jgi:hypothetical protein
VDCPAWRALKTEGTARAHKHFCVDGADADESGGGPIGGCGGADRANRSGGALGQCLVKLERRLALARRLAGISVAGAQAQSREGGVFSAGPPHDLPQQRRRTVGWCKPPTRWCAWAGLWIQSMPAHASPGHKDSGAPALPQLAQLRVCCAHWTGPSWWSWLAGASPMPQRCGIQPWGGRVAQLARGRACRPRCRRSLLHHTPNPSRLDARQMQSREQPAHSRYIHTH